MGSCKSAVDFAVFFLEENRVNVMFERGVVLLDITIVTDIPNLLVVPHVFDSLFQLNLLHFFHSFQALLILLPYFHCELYFLCLAVIKL